MWRAASVGSTIYNKTGEVKLQSNQITRFDDKVHRAYIVLNDHNTIEVQSGDVVGYYHPPTSSYLVRTISGNGYINHLFSGSFKLVDLNHSGTVSFSKQPLIQFTIGKCGFYHVQWFC